MSKVYKPSDFPNPKPDQYREEFKALVAEEIEQSKFERLGNGIRLVITDSSKYTTDNLIDFASSYATQGGWKSVNTSRKLGTIIITMTW